MKEIHRAGDKCRPGRSSGISDQNSQGTGASVFKSVSDHGKVYRMRDLYEGMSKKLLYRERAKEYLASGGLYYLYGMHTRLSDDGDPDEHAGAESEGEIQE